MEDRAKRRARLFTIVGFILALAAAGGTYLYSSSAQTAAPPPEEKVDVVVATRDLATRQVIVASDVTVVKYPLAVAPSTAAKDPKEVVGRILVSPVARNEPITAIRYTVGQGQTPFSILPAGEELKPDSPNYRAMSISVADQNAVGGAVQPGDIVDLIATVKLDPFTLFKPAPPATQDPNRVADFQTKVIFESVPILAKTGAVYTIRVSDLESAQRLIYLQSAGATLSMVLRAAKDERIVATEGTSFPSIYSTFHFKIVTRTEP